MSSPITYGAVSRINHWVIAAAIIGMVGVGLTLEFGGLSREQSGSLRDVHKAVGVLLLALVAWRVGWRLVQGFPPAVSSMPRWQSIASKAVHWALLVAIVAMPVSGLLSSVYADRAIDVFGWFTVPSQGEIEWLAGAASLTHTIVGRTLAALIVVHVAGALKHHFGDRDRTLLRMARG